MIKCTYFGKLLKQLFIISLISCFILLGNSFVNAFPDLVSVVPGNTASGTGINSFYVSSDLTFSSPVVYNAFTGQVIYSFYWDIDGHLHFYNKNRYGTSDYTITGYNLVLSGQNIILSHTGMVEYVNNHFNDIVNVNFYFGYTCQADYTYGTTFSINFNTGYIYFAGGLCEGNNLYVNPGGGPISSPSSLSFDQLHTYNSPFSSVGVLGGSVYYSGFDNSLTGDYVYINCTNGEVIQELENNGFNKYMCYGGLDNFDLYDSSLSYSPIPGTGKRLSQILSYSNAWDTPLEWFQFWDGLYQDRYSTTYNPMWESYPAVYRTWFDIYYQYGRNLNKNFDWVREYCTMTVDLNIDKTAIYKGQFFKGVCDTVIDKKINSSYYVGSGNSAVGTNWNGIGNMGSGSEVVVSNDPSKFIQDYFNIIKSNIPSRYDLGGGVLPLYIITFMLAIILFRFISH